MARRREPANSSRTARYCPSCGTYWPARIRWGHCPEDGTETYGVVGKEPISLSEAESRTNTAEFDRWYFGTWERKRQGPTPEELGAEQARVVIDLDRRATN
jgi:hypothetical protein